MDISSISGYLGELLFKELLFQECGPKYLTCPQLVSTQGSFSGQVGEKSRQQDQDRFIQALLEFHTGLTEIDSDSEQEHDSEEGGKQEVKEVAEEGGAEGGETAGKRQKREHPRSL